VTKLTCTIVVAAALGLPFSASAADADRQAEVASRGAEVMPFKLQSTTHVFTKTADGGVQRVVVKDPADLEQVRRVREHLREMQARFGSGDFSGPTHIHGAEMPGLAQLKAAQPEQLAIAYRDIAGGAELTYRSKDLTLVSALHDWFEAQLGDHGADARDGHSHHHGEMLPEH
jgi:hypothetical protein